MNDRFKFRCFSRKTKKMYEVDSLHLDSKDGEWVWVHYYNPIYDKDLKIQIVQPDAVIMQCTGLKDKNGKLIYEGDVVERKNGFSIKRGVVYFNEVFTQFNATNMSHYSLVNRSIVLGNIYQNPELLEDNNG